MKKSTRFFDVLLRLQFVVLNLAWLLLKPRAHRSGRYWVVGVQEVASMVANIAQSIPGARSVSFRKHRFYDFEYSVTLPAWFAPKFVTLVAMLLGPITLAWFASRAHGFVYVGESGFLLLAGDGRQKEFSWLKQRGLSIVCFFTGSDIRSLKLMENFEERSGVTTIARRIIDSNPDLDLDRHDELRRLLAQTADTYADAIFNAKVDQMSYIERETLPFLYFYPDKDFRLLPQKFIDVKIWRILHAPSNPYYKGTSEVRAAVERLREEGYAIEYVELIGAPHSRVIDELRTAHIVLNEFFSFLPGVFGVEALAHTCVLLTSADETIEKDLPNGSNAAWITTKHNEVERNLRKVLDNPNIALDQAIRGYEWAIRHGSSSASGAKLKKKLDELSG